MPAAPEIPILHLDAHVVVVDKPAGLLVHRTRSGSGEDALLQRVRDQLGRPIFLAQRLDRHTSGVLACALAPEVVPRLQAVLTAPGARKEYLALVRGACAPAFACDEPLVDDKGVAREARTSVARFAWLPALRASLVLVRLHTGRYHQIRRHLANRGHHVLGDPFYGRARANRLAARLGLRRPFLHAWRLEAEHPIAGRLAGTAPLPPELQDFLEVAGADRNPLVAPGYPREDAHDLESSLDRGPDAARGAHGAAAGNARAAAGERAG